MVTEIFDRVRNFGSWLVGGQASPDPTAEAEFLRQRSDLLSKAPLPTFWMFGKAQSGKTTIIRHITGAEDAVIGSGFRPCTKDSRRYDFPAAESPLISFLDTRGLGEAAYDPAEDVARFTDEAHLVVVTVRVMDHAQEAIVAPLRAIRAAKRGRPVLLALTCLHQAYPRKQHPPEYPFPAAGLPADPSAPLPEGLSEDLARSLSAQRERFAGLVDRVVPIDLTKPGEGFEQPEYGGPALRSAMMDLLPAAYAQTLRNMRETMDGLADLHERRAHPIIVSYATLAATAGASPVPLVDIPAIAGIQARMVWQLADLYGRPMDRQRFLELAGAVGVGLMARQALRELTKLVPWVGVPAGAGLAYAGTFALGKACCWYYGRILSGHEPTGDELRKVFGEQLSKLDGLLKTNPAAATPTGTGAAPTAAH